MKNEYFQEKLEKRIKITREMILSEVPNEIFGRYQTKYHPKKSSFTLGCPFSFDNFIWNFEKYRIHCDFDSLFQTFLKIFIFHLICKYIFSFGFQRKKGKNNYKSKSVRQFIVCTTDRSNYNNVARHYRVAPGARSEG